MLRTELIRPLPELLREHAGRFGDRTAFRDARRQVSFAALERRTWRLAGHLAARGLAAGDRVAIRLGNRVETVESYLGVVRAGGVGVPLDPHSTDGELAALLDDSGATVLITEATRLDQVRRLAASRPTMLVVVVDRPERTVDGELAFEALAEHDPDTGPRDDLHLDDIAWMLYTSGTTGRPKGVLSTQRNCLWTVAAGYSPVLGLSETDVLLWPLPLFHSLSHILAVVGATAVGATVRLMDSFAVADAVAELRAERYTFLAGVPTMYHRLLRAARDFRGATAGLRVCLVTGAGGAESIADEFATAFGLPLINSYGSTETCGAITISGPTDTVPAGSCGRPVPGLDLRIVDRHTGQDLPADQDGEIWVRSPSVMAGYHRRPEATADALAGGWLRTGDLGRSDAQGYLTITGRVKELIIRGGENVHPAEIESVLSRLPDVADVAVTGRPHEVLGEVPVAFVVPGPGGLSTPRLLAACRDRLSHFKVPEEIYQVDNIQRTGSGKVVRRGLLDLPARLIASSRSHYEHLFRLDWVPAPGGVDGGENGGGVQCAVIGAPAAGLFASPSWSDAEVAEYRDLPALRDAAATGAAVPALVLCAAPTEPGAAGEFAAELGDCLADARFADTRLVVLVRGAISTGPAEPPADLGQAECWRLTSAWPEFGHQLALCDVDGIPVPLSAARVLLSDAQPWYALRTGTVLVPRLTQVPVPARGALVSLKPNRAVLITGAASHHGVEIARHLMRAWGLRQLVLADPAPDAGPRLAALGVELRGFGAEVTVRNGALGALGPDLSAVDAVVHVESGTSPGAGDAAALAELVAAVDPAMFVVCSGVPGPAVVPDPVLDAVVLRRRATGAPAVHLAWPADPSLMRTSDRMAMFDAALGAGVTRVVAARATTLSRSPLAIGLSEPDPVVTTPHKEAVAALRRDIATVAADRQHDLVLQLVRTEAAAVLGRSAPGEIDPETAVKDLGFDSVAAVSLRDRLVAATGVALPATVAFDFPTPSALARRLLADLREPAPAETDRGSGGSDTGNADDPVAIIAMACRYPGGAGTPDELWRLVAEGTDAIGSFPIDRGWPLDTLFGDDPRRPGTSHTRHGGFLHDAGEFDAAFFGISPREALATDPQQRLLLEMSWELCEQAGIEPGSLRGGPTGVYVGAMFHDYATGATAPEAEGYLGIGTAGSVLSGRIAYTFGFTGPAISVDTACSSSLVALHLAAAALHRGECALALAGGVAVMATPATFIEFSRQGGLAPDGRCKSFAAGADGTGWAEGAGLLLMERLSDARRNGHPVLALLRGSAVNQDGASNGLTAPSGAAQQRVIRQALADAGLAADQVDAVEGHGTGTRLGDPIEVNALLATYGRDRSAAAPLLLGSLKSNIGHAQSAAGVGGVIKMIQAMRHGVVPKTLHVTAPSTEVDWTSGAIRLCTEATPWPDRGRPRRAGVSSFGVSGTNAHVIIEAPPPEPAADRPAGRPSAVPWVLSAKSGAALRENAHRLLSIVDDTGLDPVDVAHSLATRTRFTHRAVLVGADNAELVERLRALTECAGSPPTPAGGGKLALLFTGQGSQRAGMGRELYDSFPVYTAAFDEACAELDAQLAGHVTHAVRDVVFGELDGDLLDQTSYAQPALFAAQVALFRLLRSFGVRPDLLAGHSIGEVTAAHLAGVLTLADAAALVAARGRLMQALPPGGAMVAVEADERTVARLLRGHEHAVAIAAVNGPHATVLSGDEPTVLAIAGELAGRGRRTSRLRVSHAFHSPHMDGMLEDFRSVADQLDFAAPGLPVVSAVTGAPDTDIANAKYWVEHVRRPVRFADVVHTLADARVSACIEVGPDGVLSAMVHEASPPDRAIAAVPVLRRDRPEVGTLLSALGQADAHGAEVDWAAVLAPWRPKSVQLPGYAFQRERYWLAAATSGSSLASAGLVDMAHPLLGAAIEVPDGFVYTGRIALSAQPWLADHRIAGATLFPVTGYLELVARVGAELSLDLVDELATTAPLALPTEGGVRLRVVVGAMDDDDRRAVVIDSRPADATGDWTRHATATLAPGAEPAGPPEPTVDPWPPADAIGVDVRGMAAPLSDGTRFGPTFQVLRALWRRGDDAFAELALPLDRRADADRFGLHPALLAGALRAIGGAGLLTAESEFRLVPASWHGVRLPRTGSAELRVHLVRTGPDSVRMTFVDSTGAPLGAVRRVRLRPVPAPAAAGTENGGASAASAPPDRSLAELVRAEAAVVLGHGGADGGLAAVGSGDSFRDLGFTSLTAVELCDRLTERTGLRLSVSAIFDHATPAALALHLLARTGQTSGEDTGGTPTIDLAAEVRLPDDVRPPGWARRIGEPPRAVLLTGATGFLGAYLLRDLVRTTGARIHCLVRAASATAGRDRLRRNLADYGLASGTDMDRVTVVPGDLGRPRLGLSESDFDALARTVDAVYHAGSAVNWVYPYADLRPANVLGTQEILRLAARHRPAPVHYVSSTGVFPHRQEVGAPIGTDEPLGDGGELATGYQQSKWVAEGIVRLAGERGLPVTVYRPDVVCGDTVTGACQTEDFVWLSLKGCLQVGAVPRDAAAWFSLVPVDYVSAAVVSLSTNASNAGRTFHLYNPHTVELATMLSNLQDLGYELAELPRDAWARRVRAQRHNAALPLLDTFLDVTSGRRVRPVFDTRDTELALAGTGIDCPEISDAIFRTLVGFFVDTGYFPDPMAGNDSSSR
ncbi:type I polyketide synthase [Kutzneria sp. CA-103260]|uniref:type I polyketide synthase n=1 Tax=Kutzneria sp. CA-103260 TaxID=2802641 RepID=UPI001BA8D2FD|nr:type I polyketide synthase [Kutzneria sp. CA-103260]QUQ65302.1 2-succinylbenzoate--CoA ligase [Kutzneria sp. CA-103260]